MNTFLDAEAANEAKQAHMAQVYENAPADWKQSARWAIIILAYLYPEISSDDVWRILYKPHEGRALGPVMGSMAKAGWLEKTGKQKTTQQVTRNGTDINVWKSLVYGSEPPPHWKASLATWEQTLKKLGAL